MFPTHFTPKLITTLRQGYNLSTLKSDVLAGLTLAIVALPLSMALGIASGASPEKGLITAVVAGFFISLLGGSRVQIGGPTGAFIVVVYNVITQYGYDGLLLATFLAGIILIVAGYARFGRVVKFVPYPVVTGFTAGIAVIIASSQIKDFLGLDVANVPAEFVAKWQSYLSQISTFDLTTFITGSTALLIIILLKRFTPKLPGYLIAVLLTAVVVYLFQLPVDTIGSRFPDMSSGLAMPKLPVWDFDLLIKIVPSALTIAFLAGIESLLSAMVADGMTGYKHRSDQELIGQGVANIASSLMGGMPATGAIARTATNIKSGGKTPVAGMTHALFILVFILFASDCMAFVPLATLAAILFIVAWNMSEYHHFIHIVRLSKSERTVLLLTFSLTILVDLTVAIGVGVTLASLLFLREMNNAVTLKLQGRQIRDTDNETDEDVQQRDELPHGVEVFRITGPIYFGVTSAVIETLQSIGSKPKYLIVRMKHVPFIDVAGLNVFKNFISDCQANQTKVILCGLQKQPLEMLTRANVKADHNHLWIEPSYDDAILLTHELLAIPKT